MHVFFVEQLMHTSVSQPEHEDACVRTLGTCDEELYFDMYRSKAIYVYCEQVYNAETVRCSQDRSQASKYSFLEVQAGAIDR